MDPVLIEASKNIYITNTIKDLAKDDEAADIILAFVNKYRADLDSAQTKINLLLALNESLEGRIDDGI